MKLGKYFLLPSDKVECAERFMHRYEGGGIFYARLCWLFSKVMGLT
jgi:membrane protein DedA with SNARE-associated domain